VETSDHKKQYIIEAALKRFSHFGINKTTMSEIAEDVAVSKANLYYYFPDKTALVIDVVKHLIDEVHLTFKHILEEPISTLERLYRILKIRKDFFERHYLLHITMGIADSNLNMDQLIALGQFAEEKELSMLSAVFKKGIENEELVTFNEKNTSQIYFTIMKGIAMVSFSKITSKDIPDVSIFNEIYEKQKEATIIFLNGLRYNMMSID